MVVTGINTELEFTITFHTPFRVGASYGESGVDLTLDRDEPVGADHLKGLMRFAAHDVLRLDDSLIAAVYGSTATPSPWCWTAAVPTEEWKAPELRNRVAIDPATHAALTDHLVLAEQLTAGQARFHVSRRFHLDDGAAHDHALILRCSAGAVHGLGGWRRRGLGWVDITPSEHISATDVRRLADLKAKI